MCCAGLALSSCGKDGHEQAVALLALEKQEIWDGGDIERRVETEPLHTMGSGRPSPLPYVTLPVTENQTDRKSGDMYASVCWNYIRDQILS